MKPAFVLSFFTALFVSQFAAFDARALEVSTATGKIYLLRPSEIPNARGEQAEETVTFRLKATVDKDDCNHRLLMGDFQQATEQIMVADFYVAMTEVACPRQPVTKVTIYSKEVTVALKPYSRLEVYVPAFAELEIK